MIQLTEESFEMRNSPEYAIQQYMVAKVGEYEFRIWQNMEGFVVGAYKAGELQGKSVRTGSSDHTHAIQIANQLVQQYVKD